MGNGLMLVVLISLVLIGLWYMNRRRTNDDIPTIPSLRDFQRKKPEKPKRKDPPDGYFS